jgi:hypothetical protein
MTEHQQEMFLEHCQPISIPQILELISVFDQIMVTNRTDKNNDLKLNVSLCFRSTNHQYDSSSLMTQTLIPVDRFKWRATSYGSLLISVTRGDILPFIQTMQ